MGSITGTVAGTPGYRINFGTPVSLGVSCPANEYPHGSIVFDNIATGQAWWKENSGIARTIDFYLCSDTNGSNSVLFGSVAFLANEARTDKTFSISNATALKGKALYLRIVQHGKTSVGIDWFFLHTANVLTKVAIQTAVSSYSVTTAVSPAGTGTLSASPTSATPGTTITLTPSASTGYYLSSYTTSPTVTVSSNKFTMPSSAITVTANFAKNSYTLTTAVSPSGSGSVTAGGSLQYQATKSLTATAGTGYNFSSWSKTAGSLSSTTSNPTTFTMGAGAATVTANFAAKSYTLTVSKGTGISSVSGGGTKAYKSSNAISATASTGYTFKNWTSNNGGSFANANSASTNFTMPAGNVTVTANASVNSYTLTVSKGTGVSSVSGGGSKNYGSSNAISATMSTGYSFKNWTSNNGGTFANANSASTNFTMPAGNVTVTANGQINSYTLTTAVSPSGGGTATGGGTFNYGSSNTITATPATGYAFNGWTTTSGTLGNAASATTTLTLAASNATVTASFVKINYNITTNVDPVGSGTVTAPSTAQYGDTVNLSQEPENGWAFDSWSSSDVTIENNSFTMPANAVSITANYVVSNKIFYKDNGEWIPAEAVYKKESGEWVLQEDLTAVFNPDTNYVKG